MSSHLFTEGLESTQLNDESTILRTRSLAAVVRQQIENLIYTGQLAPGSRINEVALAARLSVSRAPIREALGTLQQAGLLEARVHRGMYVRQLTVKEAIDNYEVRLALADLAGDLLAERISDQQIDELEALVGLMDHVNNSGQVEAFFPLNVDFHGLVMASTGNVRLQVTELSIFKEQRLFRIQHLLAGEGSRETALNHNRQSNEDHVRIVQALRRRDRAMISATLRLHVINGRERSLDTMSKHEQRKPSG
jgi:DNA-binding GntR family transcriptional regulator